MEALAIGNLYKSCSIAAISLQMLLLNSLIENFAATYSIYIISKNPMSIPDVCKRRHEQQNPLDLWSGSYTPPLCRLHEGR